MTDPALAIAVPLIAGFEAFRSVPYTDSGMIWTQGYGCTFHPGGRRVSANDPPVTEAQARAWMESLVSPTMTRVRDLVRVPISNNAAAALCSFGFNCGTGALSTSTLLRLLNEGAPATQVAGQFAAWVHDARGNVDVGLQKRRAAEAALFLKPDASEEITSKSLAAEEIIPEDEADRLDDLYNPAPSETT